ncbi:hypothetical protein BG262_04405 [Floricoccus penangensis]|uniref:Nucleotidyltransferase family protein n=1 Tax=Floricoccus penangensis TaxID=1859475 RepID=A0A9Q5NZC3_9LACT|nr:nucleotidyltransferase family protein [Floricoccus penangensis]OFI46263.1 hypothetical protein BG262_04405 [Floricoccus penangensis]
MKENQFIQILQSNPDFMELLTIVDNLKLRDSWICAGTIRNLMWNYLSGRNSLDKNTDIDVIFYDKSIPYEENFLIQEKLKASYPQYEWEVKNQVYMHSHNLNTSPYLNSRDAVSKFPEKCTAIACRINPQDIEIELFAPYGVSDIVNFIITPTPYFESCEEKMEIFKERMQKKTWTSQWPKLRYLF